jgi:hypothetical protein
MKILSSFKMPFHSVPPLSQREGVNRPQPPPLDQFTNSLESLVKQNVVFNDPKVQGLVKSILSFYPNYHTIETLESFYAGLQSAHNVVSMHEEQLNKEASFRQKLEKQFKTWTRSLPLYQQMYLFTEGLFCSLLDEAKRMGIKITPEQEETLLASFRLKFGEYYPFPTEADLKLVKKKK